MSVNFGWGSIYSTVILHLTFLYWKTFHFYMSPFWNSQNQFSRDAPVKEFQTPQSSGKELPLKLFLISTSELFWPQSKYSKPFTLYPDLTVPCILSRRALKLNSPWSFTQQLEQMYGREHLCRNRNCHNLDGTNAYKNQKQLLLNHHN